MILIVHASTILGEPQTVVVDGGTDAGVMKAIGELNDGALTLVGVAAEGSLGGMALESHHAHLLVPGDAWGDEAPWLAEVASVVAGDHPSVTLLVNGGEITYLDAVQSIERQRLVIVLAETGRTADAIAAAAQGVAGDERAAAIAGSAFTRVVTAKDLVAVIQSELDKSS